jgi:T5SS/PEP-CTERM-associated repeat protein
LIALIVTFSLESTAILANQKGDLIVSGGSKLNNTGSGPLGTFGSYTVRRGFGYLGLNAGATGTATVSGTGSEWNNTSQLYVGVDGTGTLNVQAGGKVTNAYGNLGYGSLSSGTVTVAGTGSQWTNSQSLEVGYRGLGTLNVQAGGKVSNTVGHLGSNPGSHGAATVTGTGSQWLNSTALYIGGGVSQSGGNGLLAINSEGRVSAPIITIWSTGTVVGGGGTLVGHAINHGTIAPGNSVGTLTIDGDFTQASSGAVQVELGSLAAGIAYDRLLVTGNATLDGILKVALIDSFVPQIGQTFDIFDWTTTAGSFSSVALPTLAGADWDMSQLYTNGILRVVLAGDFNDDGSADAADYVLWRKGLGTTHVEADYDKWKSNFGASHRGANSKSLSQVAVPEPDVIVHVVVVVFAIFNSSRSLNRLARMCQVPHSVDQLKQREISALFQ